MHTHCLNPTQMLDYNHIELVKKREHLLTHKKKPQDKVRALYEFITTLPIGYNKSDTAPASEILADGYGYCNTKVTLLMALARGAGIPCRVHVYRVNRDAHKDKMPDWLLHLTPNDTPFLWPQFYINKKWYPLQELVHEQKQSWDSCPFDGARYQLQPLKKEWIVGDDGVWDAPDDYFRKHKTSAHGWRKLGFILVGRRALNRDACTRFR
jgi:hypothetical protein